MTKDELIALSDLNREDNIKYISSEAQGIAITLDSDRYAPTLCKLERAYICGRRKSEEQIEQLEKENAELKNKLEHRNCLDCSNHSSKLRMKTLELEKECTKAKELLAKWVELFKPKGGNIPPTKIQVDTEQFLNSEVEK
jgi:hypothetical protein